MITRIEARVRKLEGGELDLEDSLRLYEEGMALAAECHAKLEAADPRMYRVFECRYFGGMSVAETALALDTSPRTVKREWQRAAEVLRHIAPQLGSNHVRGLVVAGTAERNPRGITSPRF